ncbi:MAG: AAA family ATPase, partial [Duncaniella sp.]|nr:AAA family ATPase [Duncaniella sp.]
MTHTTDTPVPQWNSGKGSCTLPIVEPTLSIKHLVGTPITRPSTTSAPKAAEPEMRLMAGRLLSGEQIARLASLATYQLRLCGPLWFEGEICILFADTNVGKSILAVQIADLIARGTGYDTGLPELRPETFGQPVIYADFELSSQQFYRRYSVEGEEFGEAKREVYHFSPNLTRYELSYDDDDLDISELPMSEQIMRDLEEAVRQSGAKVLVVDNITFMASGTETASEAMPLMKRLVRMKKQYGLSILLLAHTPKRCLSNPLTRNDLQGSKMLINFADSAFAIGESSRDKTLRYIKQIKQRNCEAVYDANNVLQIQLMKVGPFLGFASRGTSSEEAHLMEKPTMAQRSQELDQAARDVARLKAEGLSVRQIAAQLGLSPSKVF